MSAELVQAIFVSVPDLDWERRLRFLRVDDETSELLRTFWRVVQPNMPSILDRFYRHVLAEPRMAQLLDEDTTHLKLAQEAHWRHLFNSSFDEDYMRGVRKIGRAHAKIGLEPRWYIGGYNFVLDELIHLASETFGDDRLRLAAFLKAISKAIQLDMDLAISVYHEEVEAERARRRDAEAKVSELASYDHLTGLPNRRLLLDRLAKALAVSTRTNRKGALLFVDLDHFKRVNDSFGHAAGDEVLQQTSKRLAACVREGDTVARLGGDEFVVMLEALSEDRNDAAGQAEVVGRKLLAAVSLPCAISGREFHCTPSIGIALFGDQSEDIDEVLQQADLAMYQAKGAGRNTLRFFDPVLETKIKSRVQMEEDLRLAIRDQQFELHYQAQVEKGRVIGAEALIRWRHPQHGMVSPATFIPVAEETGQILPIGRWVLETASEQLAKWANRKEMARLTLAVNVSARQFKQSNFVEEVRSALDCTGGNPLRLKLELTESMLVDNVQDIIGKMNALKSHGLRFSLDDFGTGYSSLSYLKRLPLSQLKIDQTFVRDVLTDPNDASIARTVIALGQNLGLKVIAEGVETEEQRQFLAGYGCHACQGYLFGRPVPAEAFEEQVAATGSL